MDGLKIRFESLSWNESFVQDLTKPSLKDRKRVGKQGGDCNPIAL
jgi:hypothetical protein